VIRRPRVQLGGEPRDPRLHLVEFLQQQGGGKPLSSQDEALLARGRLALASFGTNGQSLVIAMTKAQLEAAVAAARPS